MAKINPRAQRAALRRLSERANAERSTSFQPALVSSTSTSSSSSSSSSASAPPLAAPDTQFFTRLGQQLGDHLQSSGLPLAGGLSESELQRIEATHDFTFPPDLRAFLAACLPSAPGFPDWRSSQQLLRRWIALPAAHVRSRGMPLRTVLHAARPVMIPIFGFFFLPASPCRAGNPLFLIRGGAVVCLGGGLWEFLRSGFAGFDKEELREEEQPEQLGFPFSGVEDGGEGEDRENQRRWSMSSVDDPPRGKLESWGRSLDALARVSVEEIVKEVEFQSRRARRRSFNGIEEQELAPEQQPIEASSSRLNQLVMRNLAQQQQHHHRPIHHHHHHHHPSRGGAAARRIEFWSESAERVLKEHHRSSTTTCRKPDPIIGLSMCLAPPAPGSSSRRASSSTSSALLLHLGIPPEEDDLGPSSDPNLPNQNVQQPKWISSLLDDVAARLRSAGWREDDISEMVDSTSPKSVLQLKNSSSNLSLNPGKESESGCQLAMKASDWSYFLGLSSSLKRAGFSVEEVSDALCFDLVNTRVLREFN